MGIFGSKSPATPAAQNQVYNGIQLPSSIYGKVIPVLIGPNRVPWNFVWTGDWKNIPTTTPGQHQGKGLGGGGTTPGTTTNHYQTALQTVLGYGVCDHIDSLFTSSGKVGVTQLSTSFTVPGGGGHIDINDTNFTGDRGVSKATSYSATVNDFGSAGSRTLSGTYPTSLQKGSVVGPGVYTVTIPSPGVTRYTFDAADAGATVTINYSSLLGTLWMSDEFVLSGTTYSTANTSLFIGFSQVIDQGTGNAFFGPGDHSVSTHYSCDNSGHFTFNAADTGKTLLVKWQEKDPNVDTSTALLDYSLSQGGIGQSPWAYISSTHPDQALGYSGLTTMQFEALHLGQTNSMPQMNVETVHAEFMAGGGIAGANPVDVITAILTDPRWGVGLDPSLIGDWTNARNFWQANGFFISLNQDTQSTAMDVINTILDAGQGTMFWANGLLQLAVYGDTAVAGFGVIYEPDTQPVVEFDVTDFVAQGGSEPIKVEIQPQQNVFNRVKVGWKNALVDYRDEIVTEEDTASINQNGLFEEGQQDFSFIRFVNIAQWAANLRLKRFTNIRDTFTWTVPTRYRPLLQPMKLVTVTWSHMGWNQKPLRILKIEESHDGLALTMEEFPYGVANATLYPKLTAQAINANPALISPGDTDLVALELPDQMNNYQGNTIRLYADPVTPENWGGAIIYWSGDNTSWKLLGELTSSVTIGTLGGSGMTVGTGDPDTQTITVVDANDVPLLSGNTFDFANQISLLAVIDSSVEIMAYLNATLVGDSTYHVDHFHRGLFGTTRASHSAGAAVIEMGEQFLEFQFPASFTGNTVYFRALSYNKLRGRLQDVTDVSSLTVSLSGANPGLFTNAQLNVPQSASMVQFTGGTTVQFLKPAEPGAEQTTGKPVDVLADGTNYMRTKQGITLTADLPYNGDFETFADTATVADGWTKDFDHTGSGYSYARSTSSFSGTYAQAISNNGTSGGTSIASRPFAVKGGVSYTPRCRVQCNHTGTGSIYFRILWYSNDTDMSVSGSSFISFNDILSAGSVASANTYQQLSGEVQAPSNAVFARIALYNWNAGTASTAIFDRVSCQLSTIAMNAVNDDASSGRYAGSTAGGNTDGFQVLTNPEFASGSLSLPGGLSNVYAVYDNNSTGHVTISTVADVACGNTSGFKMQIAVAAAGESPGLGGFYVGISADGGTFAVNSYHKGSTYLWRIRALIPSGHNINFASNAYGAEGTFSWLTSQAGTGAWQEYVAKQVIGTTGSFSSTGFFYLDGSASSPFNWYVARCSLVNIDAPASISVNYHPRVQYLDPNSGQSPTSTMLNPQFSLLPGQSVSFTFSESGSTLGFTWGTQTLTQPDSSTLSLAGATHTFSGLTASTTYYVVAYLTRSGSSAIMNFLGPFIGGVTAAQVMQAALDGRAFMGVLHDTTTSGGTGTGGGTDPGGCPHQDMLAWVKRGDAEPVRVKASEVVALDFVKGWDFEKQEDVYRPVLSTRHQASTMWSKVGGYLFSPCETVYVNNEWTQAYKVGDLVRGLPANRAEIKLDPHLPLEQRNYWLDDGVNPPLLVHNPILPRS